MKIELTKGQCESLSDFIEAFLLDAIRNDRGIDNLDWLKNILDVHQILKGAIKIEKAEDGECTLSNVHHWINAELELPVHSDFVLAIVSGSPKENITFRVAYCLANYAGDGDWIIDGCEEWEDPTVHYWMPLPEPPKEIER